jgi:integrase
MVSQITSGDIEAALRRERPGTRNMLLSYLRATLGWAMKRGWLTGPNPVDRIERTEIQRRETEIYHPEEVQRILDDALVHDLGLLPYRVLTLYCGIRPSGEATKVEWSDILWADKIIKLRPGITKKGRPRYPQISDNALRWLQEYRERGGVTEGPIMPYSRSELNSRRRANLRRAEVKGIKNGSRHSYCSYHLAQHGDINGLTLQSGHANTDILWRHYYQAATREDAQRYWSIVPKA